MTWHGYNVSISRSRSLPWMDAWRGKEGLIPVNVIYTIAIQRFTRGVRQPGLPFFERKWFLRLVRYNYVHFGHDLHVAIMFMDIYNAEISAENSMDQHKFCFKKSGNSLFEKGFFRFFGAFQSTKKIRERSSPQNSKGKGAYNFCNCVLKFQSWGGGHLTSCAPPPTNPLNLVHLISYTYNP